MHWPLSLSANEPAAGSVGVAVARQTENSAWIVPKRPLYMDSDGSETSGKNSSGASLDFCSGSPVEGRPIHALGGILNNPETIPCRADVCGIRLARLRDPVRLFMGSYSPVCGIQLARLCDPTLPFASLCAARG